MPEVAREYKDTWGADVRALIEACWKRDDGVVDSILELVEGLGKLEDSNLWRPRVARSFNMVMRVIGIRSITHQNYVSIRTGISRYGREYVRRVGVWAATYICQVPVEGGLKARVKQGVEQWVEENGRPPGKDTARDLVRGIAPDAIAAGPRTETQAQFRKLREEHRAKLKEEQKAHRETRNALRECMRARAKLLVQVRRLSRENKKLRDRPGR